MLRSLFMLALGIAIGASIALSLTTERGAQARRRVGRRVRVYGAEREDGFDAAEGRVFDELRAESTV